MRGELIQFHRVEFKIIHSSLVSATCCDLGVKIRLWHFPICPMMIHSFPHLFHVILLPSFWSLPYPPGPFHCFLCSSIRSISPQVIISPCRFTISSLALFVDVPVTPLCDSDDVLLCDTCDYCFVNKSQFNFHTQFVFIRLRVLFSLLIYFCAATMSSLKPPGNFVRKFQGNTVTTPHVLFPAQTALENALILPVIITKDIQGWFHQSQESNLVRSFIEEDFRRNVINFIETSKLNSLPGFRRRTIKRRPLSEN